MDLDPMIAGLRALFADFGVEWCIGSSARGGVAQRISALQQPIVSRHRYRLRPSVMAGVVASETR
jgi:hypothetical protein